MKSGRLVLKKTGPNTTQTTAAKAAAVWLPVSCNLRAHSSFFLQILERRDLKSCEVVQKAC